MLALGGLQFGARTARSSRDGADMSEPRPVDYARNQEVIMAIDLSDQQRQALDAGSAVAIHDGPRTYYVISAEQFEKIKALLDVEKADPSFYEAGEIHLYGDQ